MPDTESLDINYPFTIDTATTAPGTDATKAPTDVLISPPQAVDTTSTNAAAEPKADTSTADAEKNDDKKKDDA